MHIAHHIQQPQLDSTKDYPFIFQKQEDDAEEQRLNDEFVQYLLTTVFAGIDQQDDTYRGQVETILYGGGYIMNTPQNSSMRYALRQIFLDTSASNAEIEELQNSYFLSITNIRELYNLFKIKENDEYVAVQSRHVNTPNGLRQIIIGYGLFKLGGGPNQVNFSAGLPIISNAFYTSLLNMDVDQAIREDQISKGERVGITISREYTINLDALAYFLADGDGGEFIGFFRESGILDSNLRFKVETGENPIVDGIYIEGTIDIEEFDESNYLVLVPIAFSIVNEQDGELMYDESFLAALSEPTKTLIIEAIKRKLGGSLIINKGIRNEAGQQIYQIDIPLILPKDIIERFNNDLPRVESQQDNSLLILIAYLLTALTLGGGTTFLTRKLFSKKVKVTKVAEKKSLPAFELSTTQKAALNWLSAQTVEDEIRETSVNQLQKNYTIDDKGTLDINTITELIGLIKLIANKGGRSKEYHLVHWAISNEIEKRLNEFLVKNIDTLNLKNIGIVAKVLSDSNLLITKLISVIKKYVLSLNKDSKADLDQLLRLLANLPSQDKIGIPNLEALKELRKQIDQILNPVIDYKPERKTITHVVNGQETENILSVLEGFNVNDKDLKKSNKELPELFTYIQEKFNGSISSLVEKAGFKNSSHAPRVTPIKTQGKSNSDTFAFIYKNGSVELYIEYRLNTSISGEFLIMPYDSTTHQQGYILKRSKIITQKDSAGTPTTQEIPTAQDIVDSILDNREISSLKNIINTYSWLKAEIEDLLAEVIAKNQTKLDVYYEDKKIDAANYANTIARLLIDVRTRTLQMNRASYDAFTENAKSIIKKLGNPEAGAKHDLGKNLRLHIVNIADFENEEDIRTIYVVTPHDHNSAG